MDPKTQREYVMSLVNDNQKQEGPQKSNISYQKKRRSDQRTASIQASETLHLLSIGKENFKNILMVLMQDQLELKIKMLKSMRFFMEIQPFVLIPLANQLVLEIKELDEIIVKQGEKLEFMYILHKGSCNVVRSIITKRRKLPLKESKGALKSQEDFVWNNRKVSQDIKHFSSTNKYLHVQEDSNRQGEMEVVEENNEFLVYRQSYIYKKLYPGALIFGRALTGKTLEGEQGEDRARMSVISSSAQTYVYGISQRLLSFCPEFLKDHLVNYLLTLNEVDKIQGQPLNKEIKRLSELTAKKQNFSEAERRLIQQEQVRERIEKKERSGQQQQQQQQKKQIRIKYQNESKQDQRNRDWELFKARLGRQAVKYAGSIRNVKDFKRW